MISYNWIYLDERMKDRFPLYRRTTHLIEERLTVRDREILNRFLKYCAMSAGRRRVERCKSVLLQFRDIVEKPFDEITKEVFGVN